MSGGTTIGVRYKNRAMSNNSISTTEPGGKVNRHGIIPGDCSISINLDHDLRSHIGFTTTSSCMIEIHAVASICFGNMRSLDVFL